ncbi:MAG: hypothetical protein ACKPE6_02330 [Gammaproteobacteria bacterium]
MELRSPDFATRIPGGGIEELRIFAFADAARLQLVGPLPDDSTPGTADLLGVGAGISLKAYRYLNGVIDYARALEDGSATRGGSDRVLFRVWTSF